MAHVVAVGEVMLRLSTEPGVRLADATSLACHYGGAEANVAASLARFGHHASVATCVPEGPLGDAVVASLRAAGVDTAHILRRGPRLGTYYLEAGVGARGSLTVYDRQGSSFASLTELPWDMDELFDGADLLHISGITMALSPRWRTMAADLARAASERGVAVSLDVNWRSSLWSHAECMDAVGDALMYTDVLSAGIGDVCLVLGQPELTWSEDALTSAYRNLLEAFPKIRVVFSTKRQTISASSNDLTGYAMDRSGRLVRSRTRHMEPIVDRVGGGDAFAAGMLHGLMGQQGIQETVEFAVAASALKHTVSGDMNRFTASEVKRFMGAGADVAR